MDVKRHDDRIIVIKLLIEGRPFNVVSAYAPQVGLSAQVKEEFWNDLDGLFQSIPPEEGILVGGDLNGHVGREADSYQSCHGGFGYGERNEEGKAILDLAVAYNLMIANTYFKKRDEHLITFESGRARTQIDYLLTRASERRNCADCKAIRRGDLMS